MKKCTILMALAAMMAVAPLAVSAHCGSCGPDAKKSAKKTCCASKAKKCTKEECKKEGCKCPKKDSCKCPKKDAAKKDVAKKDKK